MSNLNLEDTELIRKSAAIDVSLFKYVSPERVDILENERIAFTPPARFNDPFDMHPSIAPIRSRTYLRNVIVKTQRELPLPKEWSRKERLRFRRRVNADALKEIRASPERIAAGCQEQMVSDLNATGGVLCLSAVAPTHRDGELLWAHYANSHRGFTLEFDVKHSGFIALGRCFEVTYSDERQVIDWTDKRMRVKPFLVKSKRWEYEHEFRIFRDFRSCVAIRIGNKDVHAYPLPRAAIKGVYLGVNLEPETRARIRASVRGTSIQILQAELRRTNYELHFSVTQ